MTLRGKKKDNMDDSSNIINKLIRSHFIVCAILYIITIV